MGRAKMLSGPSSPVKGGGSTYSKGGKIIKTTKKFRSKKNVVKK